MRDIYPLLELPTVEWDQEADRLFVMSLARGFEILRAFAGDGRPLSHAELARRTGLAKPTVSRLCYTLLRLGCLEYLPQLERYQPGPAVLSLGFSYVTNNELQRVARPYLQELADYTGTFAALSVRDRLAMIYRELRYSKTLMGVRLDVGAQFPLATSAAGMAVLYAMAPHEREEVLRALRENHPAEWPALEARVGLAHEEIAKRGFCFVRGGVFADSLGIATPFVLEEGSSPLALNCGGQDYLMSEDQARNNVGPRLRDIAAAIRADAAGRLN